jgi:hypothetical protein
MKASRKMVAQVKARVRNLNDLSKKMSPGVGGLDNVLPPMLPKDSLSAIFF